MLRVTMTPEQRKERDAAKRLRFLDALKAAQQQPMEDRSLEQAVGLTRRKAKLPKFCGRNHSKRG